MNYGLYYNYKSLKDTLIIEIEPSLLPNKVLKNGDIVALFKDDTLVGYNIFNVSNIVKIKAEGLIKEVNKEVIDVINFALKNANFITLPYKEESGYRVARIIDIEEHPDSEHLHICKVDVGSDKEPLTIVCGAFNARKDLLCVCALPFTFMGDGTQIVPSKLLKVDSYGMLCSGRELGLKGYENIHGLLELDESLYKVGDDFFKCL